MEFRREKIWNVFVQDATLEGFLDAIDEGIAQARTGKTLFCANPHSLVVARGDSEFLSALRSADLLIPDGQGIVLASRILGGNIAERVSGPDVMLALAARWNTQGEKSFFFLGSSESVLAKIRVRMATEYPRILMSGTYAPPFEEHFSGETNARMIKAVNDAAPTALWVGMTAPKQEKWICDHRSELKVPFIAAVGAGFDYFAGSKVRASTSLRNAGLEWLPRLVREPRRLWRRNFVSTPVFLWNVLLQRIGLPSGGPGKNGYAA